MSTKVNQLKWEFHIYPRDYKMCDFSPPRDGYVSVTNAAHHIVTIGKSNITNYQVQITYKQNLFILQTLTL